MNSPLDRITFYVAGLGAVVTVGMFAVSGTESGVSALVGAVIAVANWVAIRFLGRRLMRSSGRGRGAAGVLLALKMGLLAAVCWLLISRLGLEPLGFMVGLGSYVVAILLGSFGASADIAARGDDDRGGAPVEEA